MIRALLLTIAIAANAQTPRGEQVFVQSCSTGYCHGARGAGAGRASSGRPWVRPSLLFAIP